MCLKIKIACAATHASYVVSEPYHILLSANMEAFPPNKYNESTSNNFCGAQQSIRTPLKRRTLFFPDCETRCFGKAWEAGWTHVCGTHAQCARVRKVRTHTDTLTMQVLMLGLILSGLAHALLMLFQELSDPSRSGKPYLVQRISTSSDHVRSNSNTNPS